MEDPDSSSSSPSSLPPPSFPSSTSSSPKFGFFALLLLMFVAVLVFLSMGGDTPSSDSFISSSNDSLSGPPSHHPSSSSPPPTTNPFPSRRILILSFLSDGSANEVSAAVSLLECYALKNDYLFVLDVRSQGGSDPSLRPRAWNKVHLLRKYLPVVGEGGWIFFTEADALVLNPSLRLESFLLDVPKHVFLVAQANAGELDLDDPFVSSSSVVIDNSAFFIRSSPEALQFLDEWWDAGGVSVGAPSPPQAFHRVICRSLQRAEKASTSPKGGASDVFETIVASCGKKKATKKLTKKEKKAATTTTTILNDAVLLDQTPIRLWAPMSFQDDNIVPNPSSTDPESLEDPKRKRQQLLLPRGFSFFLNTPDNRRLYPKRALFRPGDLLVHAKDTLVDRLFNDIKHSFYTTCDVQFNLSSRFASPF